MPTKPQSALVIFRSDCDGIISVKGKLWFNSGGEYGGVGQMLVQFLSHAKMVTSTQSQYHHFPTLDQLISEFVVAHFDREKGPYVSESAHPNRFDYVYLVTWRYTTSEVYANMQNLGFTESIGNFTICTAGREYSLDEFAPLTSI